MFAVTKTVRTTPPPLPYADIARHILGNTYQLSLVFIGDTYMHTLNKRYRKKDRATNVLAFPISTIDGEIFIDLPYTKREAQKQNTPLKKHTAYLFIHACLHLKGYDHGKKMEDQEKAILKKFRL